MARILIVVPPFAGHVNPTVSLGAELLRRGHEVAWAGPAAGVDGHLAAGQRLYDTNPELDREGLEAGLSAGIGQRGVVALKSLWEEVLLPLARAMLPGAAAAVDDFGPDLLVCDQQALAGAVVALRRDIPWITSATTSAELADPLALVPRVGGWVRDQLQALQRDAGVPGELAGRTELRRSPLLTIAYTTAALAGPDTAWPSPVCFIGPALGDRAERGDFCWERLRPERPTVLVTLGTLNAPAGGRFFSVAAAGLERADLNVVCVAPPELLPGPPDNFVVRPRVPQLALLERVQAVVCHAGHNTVCESLARGIPLVLAPIRDDQPIVADQVARAGAGVRVRFGRVRPAGLALALQRVLDEPRFGERARELAASFAAAGGAPHAAARIEGVIERRRRCAVSPG